MALLLAACGPERPVDTPTAAQVDGLRQRMDSVLKAEDQPGFSYCMVVGDSVLFAGGAGYADVARKLPVTDSTYFRVGSISKMIVALGALRLVQQQKLDLDAPLARYVPEGAFTNPWESTHPVTLAHVLEHTAGFDDMRFNEVGDTLPTPLNLDSILAVNPRSRVCRWRPGTRHSYANPGYTLAAAAIEHASGMPWYIYLRDSVLRPIGMRESDFVRTPQINQRLALGYMDDTGTVDPYLYIIHAPAGSLHTTARDMALLLRLYLNRGRVGNTQWLDRSLIRRAECGQTTNAAKLGMPYGYGLANMAGEFAGYLSHGHSGGMTSFVSNLRYYPEGGSGFFVSINSNAGEVRRKADSLLAGLLTRCDTCRPWPQPDTVRIKPEVLDSYTGDYVSIAPRNAKTGFIDKLLTLQTVHRAGDTLILTEYWSGETTALVPVTEHLFREVSRRYGDHVFGVDETGFGFLDADTEYYQQRSWFGGRFWIWIVVIAFFGALPVAVVASLIVLLVLGIRRLLRRRALAWLPWLGVLLTGVTLIALLLSLQVAGFLNLGSVNAYTLTFLASSILAPLLHLATLWQVRRVLPALGNWFMRGMLYTLLAAQAVLILYLALHGVVGMRLWV
jgi:CubicO group peptidase (beta-lactamase class C family)